MENEFSINISFCEGGETIEKIIANYLILVLDEYGKKQNNLNC